MVQGIEGFFSQEMRCIIPKFVSNIGMTTLVDTHLHKPSGNKQWNQIGYLYKVFLKDAFIR